MHFKRIAVDSADLALGMYVVMLDRPWLETPFVFQGFEIKDTVDIELLQSYCETVYVDIHRGLLSDPKIRRLLESKKSAALSTHSDTQKVRRESGGRTTIRKILSVLGLGRFDPVPMNDELGGYNIRSTVRGEAPMAIDAYELLLKQHRSVIERANQEGLIDIAAVLIAVEPAIESVLRNPNAIAWTVFSIKRSGRNYNRAVATAVWAIIFGRQLGFEREALQDLAVGGLLLDIGNVELSNEILNAEGYITIEQYEHLSQHVKLGLEILRGSVGVTQNVMDMVRCHHERADGSGYPDKLKGSNIPIFGRIAGIVDCYDAMTTKTSYSPAMAAYNAARELNEMRDGPFQSQVVEQFLRSVGMFPTGSIVELSNNNIGVVLEQNSARPLLPKIMLLLDKDRQPFEKPRILDMQKLAERKSKSNNIWIEEGHEHGAFGIDPSKFFTTA